MASKKKRMGLRAYARHRGCSPSAVSRAIQDGRISKAVRRDSRGFPKIDPTVADREWASNTDPARGLAQAPKKGKEKAKEPGKEAGAEAYPAFEDSRAKREAYAANMKELEYKKAAGELVRVKSAEKEYFRLVRITRDTLLNIPNRISAELAAISDPHVLQMRLTDEITEALYELAGERNLDGHRQTAKPYD